MKYITFLILDNKNRKLHQKNGSYYFSEKINYEELVEFGTEEEAIETLSDLKTDILLVECFFAVDDVLIPLDEAATFISDMWDGERLNIEDEKYEDD